MNRFVASGIVAGLALNITGCVIAVGTDDWRDEVDNWKERQDHNRVVTETLTIGQTRESIVASLGQADFNEAFLRDGKTFDVLFYRTRLVSHDGRTTKDETTPLVFVGNSLVGWGDAALDKAAP